MENHAQTLENIAEHFFNPDTAIFYSNKAEWGDRGVHFIAEYSSSDLFSLGLTHSLSVISDKKSFILRQTPEGDYSVLGIKQRKKETKDSSYIGSAFELTIRGSENKAIRYISWIFD